MNAPVMTEMALGGELKRVVAIMRQCDKGLVGILVLNDRMVSGLSTAK